jgi:hypothetical protein
MAEREHQGYQIALVIFVMLTVLLSITTFMFFKKYREEQQKSGELATARDTAVAERDQRQNENNSLKPLLGYPQEATMEMIAKDVAADHPKYLPFLTNGGAAAAAAVVDEFGDPGAGTVTEISNPINYRDLANRIQTELDKQNAALVQLTADKQTQEQAIVANRAEDLAKYTAAQAGQVAAETDRDGERTKFNTDRGTITGQMGQLTEAVTAKQKQMDDLDKTLSDKIAEITARDNVRGKQMLDMKDALEKNRPRNFETTDGRITAVLPRERLVYINLGSSDGLRPSVTFSVYGQDSAKLTASESKAQIEVTQISGPKSAIARVLADSRSDPILPGDSIFSPAFHPGSRVHFAIVGMTDIDGDGDSDRQRIRDLIATNNGIVDIELLDDGKVSGDTKPPKVTASTQYLIKGDAPSDNNVLTAYSRIIGEADQNGTVTLTVQQFLNMVGYKTDERTVGLGRGADPRDFAPKKSASAYEKPASPQFRERRPPVQQPAEAE